MDQVILVNYKCVLDLLELSKLYNIIYGSNIYVEMGIGKVPLNSISQNDIKDIIELDEYVKHLNNDMSLNVKINDMDKWNMYYLKFTINNKFSYETRSHNILKLYDIINLYEKGIKIEYPYIVNVDTKGKDYIYVYCGSLNFDSRNLFFQNKEDILLIQFIDGYCTYNKTKDRNIPQLYLDYITFCDETSQSSSICIWKHDDRYSYKFLTFIRDSISYYNNEVEKMLISAKSYFPDNYELFVEFVDLIGGKNELLRLQNIN